MENEPEIREEIRKEVRKKMSLKWKILIGILAALVLVVLKLGPQNIYNYIRTAPDGFFEVEPTGEDYASVKDYYGLSSRVAIPDTFQGKSVDTIDIWAFIDNKVLTDVEIPDSVGLICQSAFQNCKNLRQVTFGRNVFAIKSKAFMNCSKLE